MIRFGDLSLGDVPRIAAPLSEGEVEAAASAARYADVLELRIDQFDRPEPENARTVCRRAARIGLPILGTVRAPAEGGRAPLDEDSRLELYRAILPLVDAVDVEIAAPIRGEVTALARERSKTVVLSFHDFTRTPGDEELTSLLDEAGRNGADVVKLAVTAEGPEDLLRMTDFLRAHGNAPLILLVMGDHGVPTRVFFPLLGSLLTYGFLHASNAPGQLSAEFLFEEFLRFSPAFQREKRPRPGN